MKKVVIFTDGACSGNPGPGGWGAILRYNQNEKELSGGEISTTNNRMELMAAISALEALTKPVQVSLYTDSTYLKDGITKWIHTWKAREWKTASKKPVKNKDLWIKLDNSCQKHKIYWKWVKAHAGNKYNNLVDELAVSETK